MASAPLLLPRAAPLAHRCPPLNLDSSETISLQKPQVRSPDPQTQRGLEPAGAGRAGRAGAAPSGAAGGGRGGGRGARASSGTRAVWKSERSSTVSTCSRGPPATRRACARRITPAGTHTRTCAPRARRVGRRPRHAAHACRARPAEDTDAGRQVWAPAVAPETLGQNPTALPAAGYPRACRSRCRRARLRRSTAPSACRAPAASQPADSAAVRSTSGAPGRSVACTRAGGGGGGRCTTSARHHTSPSALTWHAPPHASAQTQLPQP